MHPVAQTFIENQHSSTMIGDHKRDHLRPAVDNNADAMTASPCTLADSSRMHYLR